MPDSARGAPLTVLVTIHGIGFQVSPADKDRGPNPAGYADALHEHLTKALGPTLSPDPGRTDPKTGQPYGPVYVQSHWPPESDDSAAGLARLDPSQPLRTGDQPIAHVALVYSHLEETTPKWGSFVELCGQALVQHRKYASLGRIARWLWTDARAYRKPPRTGVAAPSPSLARRRKPGRTTPSGASAGGLPGSLMGTLLALENDFAAYVLRNDLRERVRGFVEDALVKIAGREDVDAIVINAHSQGTAVAFDVLTELADKPARKLRHLITSGSHLRKLVDLFNWGTAIGDMPLDLGWTNFYDACDPVADGMGPDRWIPGQHLASAAPSGRMLFSNRPVDDVEVCNVDHTEGTGLRAHNYFDNVDQWIPRVADILRSRANA